MSNTSKIKDWKRKISGYYLDTDFHVLTERDFYPPEDKRVYISGVEDISGGDCFKDYANWFFKNYGKDIFDT